MKSFFVVSLLILAFHVSSAPASTACDPADRAFVCGLRNPEDLVRLTGTPWIVASHINFEFTPPFKASLGPLEAVRIDTHEVRRLYPTPQSAVDWDRKTYPDCSTPPEPFSSHGLNIQSLGGKKFRLYVANHGGRQSVEIIDVAVRGARLLTKWRGCILAPATIFPNGVVPLPGGGVALSGFGVASWRPGRGWSAVRDIKGSNGVEISRDGQWLLVADTMEKSIHRIPVSGVGEDKVLKVDFLADNLRWGEDGHLYAAGASFPEGFQFGECLSADICDVGFVVAQIDPNTLTAKEVVRSEGIKGKFGTATTALQVGQYLWIGSARGDRAAILTADMGLSQKVSPDIPVNAEREAYYGDLHLMSGNAITGYFWGVHATPNDAYRFARGESVTIDGQIVRRKSAPLDFLAVTDIAEDLGLFNTLYDANSPFSQTEIGKEIRDPATRSQAFRKVFDMTYMGRGRERALFGLDPHVVKAVKESTWQQEIDAANSNYQPGKFTTFIAYHWTSKLGGTLDRVVLFGGDKAPMPFTGMDSIKPEDLWTYLEGSRKQGYEVIAIPHQSNLSNGLMFNGLDSAGHPIDRAYAERRAANEPLIEISSSGQSETHPALSPQDEFAAFELYGQEKLEKTAGSYVRDALGRGLEIEQRTGGIDPYKFGFVGGADFHNGMSDSEEDASASVPDAVNPTKPLSAVDASGVPKNPNSSGSLTGVWAERNTRESILAALRRRETFATSGTRLKFRFFGGWEYGSSLLKDKDWVKVAYGRGIPMGGDLPAKPNGNSTPTFVAWADKDSAGANLDRLQIVKIWLENAKYIERIYDVALSDGRKLDPTTGKAPAVGNTVDLKNATYTNTIGAPELAVVWRDPHFDPKVSAAYYLRVLEIPTPRWSTIAAVHAGMPVIEGVPATIQERGWSSPVWYTPMIR
jgi:Protein of unknown function (DUF3604)